MVEIDELKPHEEVIEKAVVKLTEEMRKDGFVRDPLIVDQEEHVILDGMHRFDVLKRLGCRFAPCCLLDYMSPQISVGSWFRVFNVEDAKSSAQELLSTMKLDYAVNQLDVIGQYDADAIILTRGGNEFLLSKSIGILERCRIATDIEKQIVRDGLRVTYLSETLALESLMSEQANFLIVLPAFTKETIRKLGSEGVLLPHKVTRHVIPSRPLEIDVPLPLLTDPMITCREADERLGELLANRRVDRRAPDSVIDGRRYDEELLVFSH